MKKIKFFALIAFASIPISTFSTSNISKEKSNLQDKQNNDNLQIQQTCDGASFTVSEKIKFGTYTCPDNFDFSKCYVYKTIYVGGYKQKMWEYNAWFNNGTLTISGSEIPMETDFSLSVEVNKVEIYSSSIVHVKFVPKTEATYKFFTNFKKLDCILPGTKIPFAEINYNPNNLDINFAIYKGDIKKDGVFPLQDDKGNKVEFITTWENKKQIVYYVAPKGKINYKEYKTITVCLLNPNEQDNIIMSVYTDRINLDLICPNRTDINKEIYESTKDDAMSLNYYSEKLTNNEFNSKQNETQLAFSFNFTLKDKILPVKRSWDSRRKLTALYDCFMYEQPNPSYFSDAHMNYSFNLNDVSKWQGYFIDEFGNKLKNWQVDHLEAKIVNSSDPHMAYDDNANIIKIENQKEFGYMTIGVYINTPKKTIADINYSESIKANLIIGNEKIKFSQAEEYFDLKYNTNNFIEYANPRKPEVTFVQNNPKYNWCDYLGEYKQNNIVILKQDIAQKPINILTIGVKKGTLKDDFFEVNFNDEYLENNCVLDKESSKQFDYFKISSRVKDKRLETNSFSDKITITDRNHKEIFSSKDNIEILVEECGASYAIHNTWMSLYEFAIKDVVIFYKEDFCFNDEIQVKLVDESFEQINDWKADVIDQGTFKSVDLIPKKKETKTVAGYLQLFKDGKYVTQTKKLFLSIRESKITTNQMQNIGTFANGVSKVVDFTFENLSPSEVSINVNNTDSKAKWNSIQTTHWIEGQPDSFGIEITIYLKEKIDESNRFFEDRIKFDVYVLWNKVLETNKFNFKLVKPTIKINLKEREYSMWSAIEKNAGIVETFGGKIEDIRFFVSEKPNPDIFTDRTNIDDLNSWVFGSKRSDGFCSYNVDIKHVGLTFNRNNCFMKVKIVFQGVTVYETNFFEEWVTQN